MMLKLIIAEDAFAYVNLDDVVAIGVRVLAENEIDLVFHLSNGKTFAYTINSTPQELDEHLSRIVPIYDLKSGSYILPKENLPEVEPFPSFVNTDLTIPDFSQVQETEYEQNLFGSEVSSIDESESEGSENDSETGMSEAEDDAIH